MPEYKLIRLAGRLGGCWRHHGQLQNGKAGKPGATQLEKSESLCIRETKSAAQPEAKGLRGPTSKELLVQACVQS